MSIPMQRPTDEPTAQRLEFPDGTAIDLLSGVEPAPATESRDVELHVCPACASKLVVPVAWEEAGPAHWDVTLSCPSCDWLGGGVFNEGQVERFDEELDRGTEALVRDLQRLMRANMEDEIDRFVAALAADAIWPMDF
jgi:hypothetical protein